MTPPEIYRKNLAWPSMDAATCIWYWHESKWVKHGIEVKWLINLDQVSHWTAKDYHNWAVEYYERDIDILDIERLFRNQFTEELAKRLNPEINITELQADLEQISIKS